MAHHMACWLTNQMRLHVLLGVTPIDQHPTQIRFKQMQQGTQFHQNLSLVFLLLLILSSPCHSSFMLLNPVATQMPWSTQVLFKVQSITDRIVRPCNYIEPSSCTDSLVLTPLLNLESSVAILLTAHGTCTWYSDNLVQVLVLQYKYDTVCRQAINNVCNECDTECVTSTGYCG